jgi:signal transduction histidine kinase
MINGVKHIEKIIPSLISGLELFVLLADNQGRVLYQNDYSRKKFGKVSNLSKIEHYFSFDICIIKEEEILSFTPIKAAIESKQNFLAAVSYEEERYVFRKATLKSFSINQNKLFIVSFDDVETKDARLTELQQEVDNLKALIAENKILKQKAENQSVKTALINRVSSIIRECFNISEITQKALSETAKTLGVEGIAFFCDENLSKPKFNINFDEDISYVFNSKEVIVSEQKLVVPVIHSASVLGYLALSFGNKKRIWQKDEVELVENIATQLAIAINQVGLFNELEKQKKDVQNALEELKKTQIQLIQSEKMASLGQLVAGIAHEINTPLGAINSNTDMISRCVEKIEEGNPNAVAMVKNILPITQDAIGRINVLVKSLKNFARLDEAAFQEADLHEGILSTLDLIHHEIKNRIEIVKNFGELPPIKCKPNAINQVFMNVLVNAYQSIEGQGTITITTSVDGENVFVKIKDTGRGIKEENLAKIFDPGFTTKGVGVGTGLGLSISYEIIKDHKGQVFVASEVGKGTEFKIVLPINPS